MITIIISISRFKSTFTFITVRTFNGNYSGLDGISRQSTNHYNNTSFEWSNRFLDNHVNQRLFWTDGLCSQPFIKIHFPTQIHDCAMDAFFHLQATCARQKLNYKQELKWLHLKLISRLVHIPYHTSSKFTNLYIYPMILSTSSLNLTQNIQNLKR